MLASITRTPEIGFSITNQPSRVDLETQEILQKIDAILLRTQLPSKAEEKALKKAFYQPTHTYESSLNLLNESAHGFTPSICEAFIRVAPWEITNLPTIHT